MNRLITILTTAVVLLMSGGSAVAQLKNVGTVVFPTSGSPEAQKYFLRGAAILHSFGWKQAIEQFHKAQELDPDFAMAYWGEALCYNHPLQNEGNLEEPRQVLKRLGATPEARLAKAPTDREKGFLRAVEAKFFNEGDAAQRKFAYRDAMQQLYEAYPNDHEVASYYALSLLSAASRMGGQRHRVEVLAGSIAMKIFAENPNHPGAAHYLIHSYDDPVHAPIGLRAARVYAKIAPAATHALQYPLTGMLKGDVEIVAEPVLGGGQPPKAQLGQGAAHGGGDRSPLVDAGGGGRQHLAGEARGGLADLFVELGDGEVGHWASSSGVSVARKRCSGPGPA